MGGFTVIIKKQPQKYLDKLPEPERGRVAAAKEINTRGDIY